MYIQMPNFVILHLSKKIMEFSILWRKKSRKGPMGEQVWEVLIDQEDLKTPENCSHKLERRENLPKIIV